MYDLCTNFIGRRYAFLSLVVHPLLLSHTPFPEALEPDSEAEERLIVFLYAEIGDRNTTELFVVLGRTTVHRAFEIEEDVFLPRKFHSLQSEKCSGSGVAERGVKRRDEVVHVVLVPHKERRGVRNPVCIANRENLALTVSARFAFEDEEKLARIRQFAFADLHAMPMEAEEFLCIHFAAFGMETERFLELSLLVLRERGNQPVQIAQVVYTVCDSFACFESQCPHGVHTETSWQVLLVVIGESHSVELLLDFAAHLGRGPSVRSGFGVDPNTADLRLLGHNNIFVPRALAQEIRHSALDVSLLILGEENIPFLARANGIEPPGRHEYRYIILLRDPLYVSFLVVHFRCVIR